MLGGDGRELDALHAFVDDNPIARPRTSKLWGDNTIGFFFAPDVRYRSGEELGAEVREFKSMVEGPCTGQGTR